MMLTKKLVRNCLALTLLLFIGVGAFYSVENNACTQVSDIPMPQSKGKVAADSATFVRVYNQSQATLEAVTLGLLENRERFERLPANSFTEYREVETAHHFVAFTAYCREDLYKMWPHDLPEALALAPGYYTYSVTLLPEGQADIQVIRDSE